VAVLQAQVAAHIKNIHGGGGIHVDQTKLNQACSAFSLLPEFPTIGLGPIHEVEGLTIAENLVCGICGALSGALDKMQRHHSKNHSSFPRPSEWKTVKVQRLNQGAAKSAFQIIPKNPVVPSKVDQVVQHYRQEVQQIWDSQDREEGEVEDRLLNAWLRSTRWHEHVEPYKTEELRQLVAPLAKEEYPELKAAVFDLLSMSLDVIKKMPELVLQRLNTPDPAKT